MKINHFSPYMIENTYFLKGIFKNKINSHPVLVIAETKDKFAFVISRSEKSKNGKLREKNSKFDVIIKKSKNLKKYQQFQNDSLIDISTIYFTNKRDFKESIYSTQSNVLLEEEQLNILRAITTKICKEIPNITFINLKKTGEIKELIYSVYKSELLYSTSNLLRNKELPSSKINILRDEEETSEIFKNLALKSKENIQKVENFCDAISIRASFLVLRQGCDDCKRKIQLKPSLIKDDD